jgi:hypothetical protein
MEEERPARITPTSERPQHEKEYAMHYNANGNGASRRRCLSGASLAQLVRNMSPSDRAILAADILDGNVVIMGLTRRTVTAMCGATSAYVDAALRCTPEQRAAIARGERRLILPRSRAPAPFDWAKIDDTTLVEAVRRIGLERTLDAAIAADR